MTAPFHHCRVLGSPWPGIYLTWTESARHYARHAHDAWCIGWLEDGAQTSASERGQVQAYRGDLLAANPGEVHDGRPLASVTRRWRNMYFSAEGLADALGFEREQVAAFRMGRAVLQDAALRRALHALQERVAATESAASSGTDRLACDEALAACWHRLQRHGTPRAQRNTGATPALERVRERLAASLDGAPSLRDLAGDAGLSPWQLLRAFRRQHGLSPHEWLAQLRCARARHLIAGGMPLADAAHAAGYSDQAHMTRSFGAMHGYTPGAWRRAAARAAQ